MALDIGKKWDEFRPTKTQAFWFAAAAVAVTLIAGFGFAGWVTGAKAEEMRTTAAEEARHQLATAICVDEFMAAKDSGKRLATLADTGWYERSDMVAEAGYATMPDRQEPNHTVAMMCAAKLAEQAEQKKL